MSSRKSPGDDTWPQPPSEPEGAKVDFAKARYQARLDEVKARYEARIDKVKAHWQDNIAAKAERRTLRESRRDSASAMEDKLLEAVHASYLEVTKGALDRSLQRANFVTAAAGAIGTTYAALLALVYSADTSKSTALPAIGIVPTIFLGLSLLLSAFYVA